MCSVKRENERDRERITERKKIKEKESELKLFGKHSLLSVNSIPQAQEELRKTFGLDRKAQ